MRMWLLARSTTPFPLGVLTSLGDHWSRDLGTISSTELWQYVQTFLLLLILSDVDFVLVPVGGGGLIGGIASHLKQTNPAIQVIGCQPKNDNAMQQCVAAGKIFDIEVKSPSSKSHPILGPTHSVRWYSWKY